MRSLARVYTLITNPPPSHNSAERHACSGLFLFPPPAPEHSWRQFLLKLVLGPVSRILCAALRRVFIISLASLRPLPAEAGCGIPVAIGRAAQPPILPCTGRGLSCRRHCWRRGGLLPHLFTLTPRLPAWRSVLCDTFRRRALKRAARTCREARAASCPAVSGLSSPSV